MDQIFFSITLIACLSILAQWIGWRFKIPAIVFLLVFGFIVGPVMGWLQPQLFLGDFLKPFVSLAVAIILFEGALSLNFRELRSIGRATIQIVLIGGALTWVLTSTAAHYLADLSWPISITLGAILIVTGPTVIVPLLKHAGLHPNIANLLKWEGIINDPIGAVLAILSFEFFLHMAADKGPLSDLITTMGISICILSIASYVLGVAIAFIFKKGWMPEYLKPPFLFTSVILLYMLCDQVLHESGLIAVTVLGITLANKDLPAIEEIKRFKENLTILLVSAVFILLTADLDLALVTDISLGGVLFILSIIFLIRPVSVFIATWGSEIKTAEKFMAAWIAPRGIVATAVAGILSAGMIEAGFEGAEQILPIVFYIVVATVLLHGFTAKPLGRALKIGASEKSGLMIVGASNWTTNLATELKNSGFPVIIADKNWGKLKEARLADIKVYYGEVMSEDTDFNVELANYNTLLAATDNPAYNALICSRFSHDFNRDHVFHLSLNDEDHPERKRIQSSFRGQSFMGGEYGFYDLWRMYKDGWRFQSSKLSEQYTLDDFKQTYNEDQKPIIIGVIKKDKRLKLFAKNDIDASIKEEDTILALVKTEEEKGA